MELFKEIPYKKGNDIMSVFLMMPFDEDFIEIVVVIVDGY